MNFYIAGLGIEPPQVEEINGIKLFFSCEFDNFTDECELLEKIDNITIPIIVAINIEEDTRDKFTLCAELRKHDNLFVIFITKSNNPDDRVRLLSLGAIATINSPYRGEEILRIASALTMVDNSVVVSDTNFQLNVKDRTVCYQGDDVKLTPKAYDLLVYFLENESKVISREEIMTEVFDSNDDVSERNIDTIVKQLRKATDYDVIQTVRGIGYTYVEE